MPHRNLLYLLTFLYTLTPVSSLAQKAIPEKPRIIISTDIGGTDPDDNQSMAHLLMYSNEFDIEGLISSPSFGSGSKKEILHMIDIYEKDLPVLSLYINDLKSPQYLRSITKQGRTSAMPPCGYGKPTEGSEWIVKQARYNDKRPLYILVWGCLEDVAQALHDAPDIAEKIRVYWIGGPNKKWGVNSYIYLIENFPDLWMIENNTTYRGFIYQKKKKDEFNSLFYDTYIKGAGNLGADFGSYYQGNPKLGDTPSLLYMMDGDPSNPEKPSWGGQFAKCERTPRRIFYGSTSSKDTAQVCGIIEWHLKGPIRNGISSDSACVTLSIRNQQWKGFYAGNGNYIIRHSTYYTGVLSYTITSSVDGFTPIQGEITVINTWNNPYHEDDYIVGRQWWTDSYAPADYWNNHAGAETQLRERETIMKDWGKRWSYLKNNN